MHISNGQLVMDKRNCRNCNAGIVNVPVHEDCSRCKGTGRTKGGLGKGTCRANGCYMGKVTTAYDPQICEVCNGDYYEFEDQTPFDYMSRELWKSLPFRVIRQDRQQTMAEYLLGVGCYSCTDYGRSAEMTDEELIESVRNDGSSTQGIKIVKSNDDLTVCDFVGIYTNHNGYSVIGTFKEDA